MQKPEGGQDHTFPVPGIGRKCLVLMDSRVDSCVLLAQVLCVLLLCSRSGFRLTERQPVQTGDPAVGNCSPRAVPPHRLVPESSNEFSFLKKGTHEYV